MNKNYLGYILVIVLIFSERQPYENDVKSVQTFSGVQYRHIAHAKIRLFHKMMQQAYIQNTKTHISQKLIEISA